MHNKKIHIKFGSKIHKVLFDNAMRAGVGASAIAQNDYGICGRILYPQVLIPYPFYITSEQDDKWGEIVVLCIESEPINTEYILDTIKKTLDKYQVPKKIIFIPQFSRTKSGKIKRTKF